MKTGNRFYMELSREIFTEEYKNLSRNAKWLFICLNELEQRFCPSEGRDWFLATNDQLCQITGFSEKTLKIAKAELRETDLVEMTRGKWIYVATGKSSIKQPTRYRILK